MPYDSTNPEDYHKNFDENGVMRKGHTISKGVSHFNPKKTHFRNLWMQAATDEESLAIREEMVNIAMNKEGKYSVRDQLKAIDLYSKCYAIKASVNDRDPNADIPKQIPFFELIAIIQAMNLSQTQTILFAERYKELAERYQEKQQLLEHDEEKDDA